MNTPHSKLNHPNYRADIDGLRGIAVLAVVAFHALPKLIPGGFIGVDVFFVISGYLISLILFESLGQGGFSFREFYFRRIRRIFPALLLVLAVSLACGWPTLLAEEYAQLGKHVAAGAGFSSNFLLWSEAGYFDNLAETKPLLHLWSLAVEEQFYLAWPVLLWLFWKARVNLLLATAVLALASFVLCLFGVMQDAVAAFYAPQYRVWEILAGGLLAGLTLAGANGPVSATFNRLMHLAPAFCRNKTAGSALLANLLSIMGFALLILGFFCFNKTMPYPGVRALLPVLAAVCLIWAGSESWLNRALLSHKLLVWVGLMSFPLYLWHWPLLSFARLVVGEMPSGSLLAGLLLAAFVLAGITYRWIERPIRSWPVLPQKAGMFAVLMLVVGCMGFAVYQWDGLNFRSVTLTAKQHRQNLKKKAIEQRGEGIRSGLCHFNHKGQYQEIGVFVEHWRCYPDAEGWANSRILVFGDSHSADKAMGLRRNGVDVVQIGGAGCSLNPALATKQKAYCAALFDLAKHHGDKFDAAFISNYFSAADLSRDNLSAILSYWSGTKPVYLFTPMPDFTSQINTFLNDGQVGAAPDFSAEVRFLELLAGLKIPKNIKIIKTSDLWCTHRTSDFRHPCAAVKSGQLLMIDGGHLTTVGAEMFAKNMLEDAELARVLRGK